MKSTDCDHLRRPSSAAPFFLELNEVDWLWHPLILYPWEHKVELFRVEWSRLIVTYISFIGYDINSTF